VAPPPWFVWAGWAPAPQAASTAPPAAMAVMWRNRRRETRVVFMVFSFDYLYTTICLGRSFK
jgi:hypothetical protein